MIDVPLLVKVLQLVEPLVPQIGHASRPCSPNGRGWVSPVEIQSDGQLIVVCAYLMCFLMEKFPNNGRMII